MNANRKLALMALMLLCVTLAMSPLSAQSGFGEPTMESEVCDAYCDCEDCYCTSQTARCCTDACAACFEYNDEAGLCEMN